MPDESRYFDIDTFLKKAETLDWIDLIKYGNQECDRTMARIQRTKRNDPDEYTYRKYYDFVHPATYLFTMGGRPASLSATDFQRLKPVIEALVEKGQWKADSLHMFE